jgi:exonuclease VII small subunit
MGNRTLNERVLDLEQSMEKLEQFHVMLDKKIKIYDRYVATKKSLQLRAARMRELKKRKKQKEDDNARRTNRKLQEE